jgi:hypothetical protein
MTDTNDRVRRGRHGCTRNGQANWIAQLVKLARSAKFDFLAYLLAMALKKSRRLSAH